MLKHARLFRSVPSQQPSSLTRWSHSLTNIADLVFELHQLSDSFSDGRANLGNKSFSLWVDLRRAGNLILWDVSLQGFLVSVDGVRTETELFDDLVGFHLDGNLIPDAFGINWEIGPGLIAQRSIWTEFPFSFRPSVESIWDRHAFELFGRCASACAKILAIIEKEKASASTPNQVLQIESDRVGKAPKLTVNEKMIVLIQKNPDARDYSANQWANALDVAKSTIHETKTWKSLMDVRRSEGASRQSRQSNASFDKPNAPGKSKKIRPEELL
jgi:hypothetical protein